MKERDNGAWVIAGILVVITLTLLVYNSITNMTGLTINSWKCEDSDNTTFPIVENINQDQSYFTQGVLKFRNKEYYDLCKNEKYIIENLCYQGKARRTTTICPEKCQYGKCISQEEFIEGDSDNGRNPYIIGYVRGITEKYDSCIFTKTAEYVAEYYFKNGKLKREKIDCLNGCDEGACICKTDSECPENHFCNKGKCIEGTRNLTCIDTDGGKEYNIRGNCTDGKGTVKDICLRGGPFDGELFEFSCRGICIPETYTCPNGCDKGACIPEANQTV